MPAPSSPPDGKSFSEDSFARPMSTVQVVGPRDPRPHLAGGRLEIENVSESAQPWRRRYITASRTPLPDSSASEPSGLKIRSARRSPRSSVRESSSTPSAPTPVCGAQSARDPLRR